MNNRVKNKKILEVGFMAQSKYTRAQRQAYYSGMGYSTAYSGKEIKFDNPENKASFNAGWKAGKKMVEKSPSKYPPLGTTKKASGKRRAGERNRPQSRPQQRNLLQTRQ